MEITSTLLLAFGITLLAGLSTGVGSAIGFLAHHTNTRFLAIAIGFSAGVMIYVSFVEIFVKALESLTEVLGESTGYWVTTGSFFMGVLAMAVIDRLVPLFENPHEMRTIEELQESEVKKRKLYKMGIFTALAISIHNFPEGFATFLGAMEDLSIGIPIAIAVAIHNIPEGIAVSVPLYHATGSKRKAFFLSFASGLAEPLGALVGFFLLSSIFNEYLFGISFAAVAGIMVFISLDELLPAAQQYGEHHAAVYGMIGGMAVMALSLLLFA
jgi:ZIP family zinc transporter